MFYQISDLEEHLKCPKCNEKFDLPRILPCGKSVCETCLKELTDANKIKCPLCTRDHLVPDDGFIINEFILRTNELKAKKVYRCASYDEFDRILLTIERDIKEIEAKYQLPQLQIREHCKLVRNQIDIATETLIQKINNIRESYIGEINLFEEKCIKSFVDADLERAKFKETYEKLIEENANKLDEYYSYVNQPIIDECKIRQLIVAAKIQEYKLKNQLKLLNGKLFGKNLVSFEEFAQHALDSSIVGKIIYENLCVKGDMVQIEKLIEPCIEKEIEHHATTDKAIQLKNGTFLIRNGQFLRIVDDFNTLVEIRFDYAPEHFAENSLVDSIFVQHYRNSWKNNRKEKNETCTLSVYDYNLNLANELTLECSMLTCTTNNENIFVQSDANFAVSVYNWKLEKLLTIGQTCHSEKPFYFNDCLLKLVKNDKLYLKKSKPNEYGDFCVRIVTLKTGDLLREFFVNVNFDHFFVDALDRAVVLDSVFSSIKVYDKPSAKSNRLCLLLENRIDLTNTDTINLTLNGHLYLIKNKSKIEVYSFCDN
jgi:hypothetical protein